MPELSEVSASLHGNLDLLARLHEDMFRDDRDTWSLLSDYY